MSVQEAVEAFTDLVARGEAGLVDNLDHALFLIAAAATTGLPGDVDIDAQRQRLDKLADSSGCNTPEDLAMWLFADRRFVGNRGDYYNADNSYLNRVLDLGRGIPISLSALFIEVGRRRGLHINAVGMPGHFLTQIAADTYVDAFDGGTVLDAAGCERLFQQLAGHGATLPVGSLAHTPLLGVVQRVLANLRGISAQSPDRRLTEAVVRLRAALPAARPTELLELANFHARSSKWDAAADVAEQAAQAMSSDRAEAVLGQATRWRARLN